MKVELPLIKGYIPDKYSKHAGKAESYEGNPCISFPIKLQDIPQEAKALAVTLIDYDTIPDLGYAWIHWLATNFKPGDSIVEDISRIGDGIVQGKNTFMTLSSDERIISHYIGPKPPKDHVYTFVVYAVDEPLDLKEGFYLNEFYKAVDGHVLAEGKVNFLARS